MCLKLNCILIFFMTIPLISIAQDSTLNFPKAQSGISVEYGLGSYSAKDEYISQEKYTGNLPFYALSWERYHFNYTYNLVVEYRNSAEIKNNNVSTDITQFSINQNFMYPFKSYLIFDKPLSLWLGPSTEIFVFSNDQQIAVSGFDYAQSYAALFSVGLHTRAVYPLNNCFTVESSLGFTALSFGIRMVDADEGEESPVKILTLFTGTNSAFDIGVSYLFWNKLSLKLAYTFEMTRISAWDPLLTASDNLIISFTYRF